MPLTRSRLFHFLRQALGTFAAFLIISLLMDWYRAPAVPPQAGELPLHTLQGRHTTLAEAGGSQTAVLYFWGSWCGVCRHTSPAVDKLSRHGVPVVGVALQSGSDADVRGYLKTQGWQFDTVNDPHGQWARPWQVRVTPTIVLVKNGRVRHSTTGIASYWGLRARIALLDWLG
ncbi:protein disulfide oxidoreductase [Eikenella sp. S3360]|uniref:Protein disulfide oxidoreductase n=1 Tax=Eikenella glucosivorans TaxID=2766967 RepID=A0ABS0N7Q9_9NEIS|nr:protein disulfide oxidoreductase [Eikenella glucosivorans]MBH5328339.1 protein disulfide oxidoreductase [Eikenella glucosivorans]